MKTDLFGKELKAGSYISHPTGGYKNIHIKIGRILRINEDSITVLSGEFHNIHTLYLDEPPISRFKATGFKSTLHAFDRIILLPAAYITDEIRKVLEAKND